MLQFTTRDGSSSSGKAWVFLCALPEEAKAWLTTVSEDIFQFCNCALKLCKSSAGNNDDFILGHIFCSLEAHTASATGDYAYVCHIIFSYHNDFFDKIIITQILAKCNIQW